MLAYFLTGLSFVLKKYSGFDFGNTQFQKKWVEAFKVN